MFPRYEYRAYYPVSAGWMPHPELSFLLLSLGSFNSQRLPSSSVRCVDYAGGHGTHTAGSAAGAVVSSPSYSQTGTFTEVCEEGRDLSCVGGCIDVDDVFEEDDLVRCLS